MNEWPGPFCLLNCWLIEFKLESKPDNLDDEEGNHLNCYCISLLKEWKNWNGNVKEKKEERKKTFPSLALETGWTQCLWG